MKNSEIERKFLVEVLPSNIKFNKIYNIKQGYINEPKEKTELRLRAENKSHFLTIKIGEGLIRREIEVLISEHEFKQYWLLTKGKRIMKIRKIVSWNRYKLQIDFYKANLKGLLIAEVEFQSQKSAKNFTPPSWFGKEVTNDKKFKNKYLSILKTFKI